MKNLPVLLLMLLPVFSRAQQTGFVVTEHGFRYVNHTNTGGQKPRIGETVLLHFDVYIGDSLMSSTFDGDPREFTLPSSDQLPKRVPPVYDALLLSGKGDSATIYERIDSFLLKFVPESLKAEQEIRYNVVLLDILSQEVLQKRAAEEERIAAEDEKIGQEAMKRAPEVAAKVTATTTEYANGKLTPSLTTTASGLKMFVVEQGSGSAVRRGENIRVHYYGVLTNGSMFDNSFERGQSLPFKAGMGQMIPGFDEGAMLLNHGGKAYLFIPPQLGYGEQTMGDIPANSELVFYIEVL